MSVPTAPERRDPIVFPVEGYGSSPCAAMLHKKCERRGSLVGNTLLGNMVPKNVHYFYGPTERVRYLQQIFVAMVVIVKG